jgi:LysM repeat protein
MHHQCTAQAAFLVSATFAGGSPLGSQASSESTRIKRLLPIAAAPAAMAGLAAAFALGNAPAAAHPAGDASVRHPAATAATSQAATPQAEASAAQLLSITQRPTADAPVVRLNATRVTAIQPKGKHHRTATAKYVVKSGDTLASIAQRLYHSPDYWTALYWANHGAIKYASEIQAGQVLTVPVKPAKIPGAPQSLAPAAAPAPATSTASSAGSYATASTAEAAPAQTASTYTGSSGSFQACVIAAESGGNSQVMNSSGHYGLYQFSASTWAAYGGNPADFGHASVAEQNQVFDNAIAAGGESNWAPYDGC